MGFFRLTRKGQEKARNDKENLGCYQIFLSPRGQLRVLPTDKSQRIPDQPWGSVRHHSILLPKSLLPDLSPTWSL